MDLMGRGTSPRYSTAIGTELAIKKQEAQQQHGFRATVEVFVIIEAFRGNMSLDLTRKKLAEV